MNISCTIKTGHILKSPKLGSSPGFQKPKVTSWKLTTETQKGRGGKNCQVKDIFTSYFLLKPLLTIRQRGGRGLSPHRSQGKNKKKITLQLMSKLKIKIKLLGRKNRNFSPNLHSHFQHIRTTCICKHQNGKCFAEFQLVAGNCRIIKTTAHIRVPVLDRMRARVLKPF